MTTSEQVRDAFKYLYPDELPFLKRLVQSLPENPVVVNIGAGSGTSGLAILECREDSILHTIDIQDDSSPFGCLFAERHVVRSAGLGYCKNVRWFQHHGDSKVILPSLDIKPSMCFIDGDHTYEGCYKDIENCLMLTRPGGIIAVHDYMKSGLPHRKDGPHPQPWPEVDKAVNDLLKRHFKLIGHVWSLVAYRV